MFLLFLIGLGTANVNAQVRIGGNAAPQGAAVLDLNADNTATPAANKGALALPRVRLDSTTAKLNGTTPITGMLVYNTNTTLGAGIYFWSGTAWVKTSLPVTSVSDSGKFLMSNGSSYVLASPQAGTFTDTAILTSRNMGAVTWSKVLDTTFVFTFKRNTNTYIQADGITLSDFCLEPYNNLVLIKAGPSRLFFLNVFGFAGTSIHAVKCYRPSL